MEASALTDLVVITGFSGAGKSTAMAAFEDEGYFCVDNLPSEMIRTLVELFMHSGSKVANAAVVSDVRGGEYFEGLAAMLDDLRRAGCQALEQRDQHGIDGSGIPAGVLMQRPVLERNAEEASGQRLTARRARDARGERVGRRGRSGRSGADFQRESERHHDANASAAAKHLRHGGTTPNCGVPRPSAEVITLADSRGSLRPHRSGRDHGLLRG
ncbi:MAG: hypothetical protein M3010_10965, partial [Candidatus Dormibacteraeota bacterium]|nr:hypothetical protein [Candidatus Dormibacteraeota bacterium]